MQLCRQRLLQQRLRRTKASPLSTSVFEPPGVMEPELLVQVPKRRSECWLGTGSELAGLKMSRLSPTTGLVDLVVDAADASNLSGVFLHVLRFSDTEASG